MTGRLHLLSKILLATAALSLGAGATAIAAAPPVPPKRPPVLPKSLKVVPVSITDAPGIPEADGTLSSPFLKGSSPQSIDMPGTFRCTNTWSYIAAQANSFVTGNCGANWEMDRTKKQYDNVHDWYWDGGYFGKTYDGCGWMREQDSTLQDNNSHSGCPSPDKAYCEYIICVNGTPWTFGGSNDGAPTNVKQRCWEYANYRPWSDTPAPADPLVRYVDPNDMINGSYRLRARYVTRTAWAGNYFVMVHDAKYDKSGDANWVFVPFACF